MIFDVPSEIGVARTVGSPRPITLPSASRISFTTNGVISFPPFTTAHAAVRS